MSKADLLDLDRDLPTSEEDVAALRRARAIAPADWLDALQELHDALPPRARQPRRSTDRGRPDLEL